MEQEYRLGTMGSVALRRTRGGMTQEGGAMTYVTMIIHRAATNATIETPYILLFAAIVLRQWAIETIKGTQS